MLDSGLQSALAITGLPIATVPRPRKVFVHASNWSLGEGIDLAVPGFLNLPPVKPVSIHLALRRAGLRAAAGADAVLAYNALPGPGSAGLAVARKLGVPFICVLADYSARSPRSPFRAAELRWSTRIVRRSDGLVVVSGHTIEDLGVSLPWVKVEGGLSNDWDELPKAKVMPKTIVYAGTPTFAGGALLLLDAFRRIDDPGMRLVFAGRGGLETEILAAASEDPRVQVKGFLLREEMQKLLASGTVLVNPRLSAEKENRFNFPSKILDYLASGRPVVTTLAGDLDAVYRRIAIPLSEETPESLARLLVDLCSRPEGELAAIGARGRDFVLSERRWESQARRVYDLVERVIGDRRP